MATTYTQYINGVKFTRNLPSGSSPRENQYKVHHITVGSVVTVHPNYIDTIKSVGTDRQWTNVDIEDLDVNDILALTIEEADKVRGPFRSVKVSTSQSSGAGTSSAPSIIVWEKII